MEASKSEEGGNKSTESLINDQVQDDTGKESGTTQEPSATKDTDENPSSNDRTDTGMMYLLARHLMARFGLSENDEPRHEPVIEEFTLGGIAKYIKEGKGKNIIVMTGAGISTSAGIPDFRTPGSGLYDNLSKFNLPTPESIFEIQYFKENPDPFFMLSRELFPGNYMPTPGHYFIRLLEEKNVLLRNFTQNIDGLELVAGVSPDRVVAAHGTFHTAHCLDCDHEYSQEWEKEQIFKGGIPKCEHCEGVVKPDIVFFGESLPRRFFNQMTSDFPSCDLLIVMGTSLVVQPFASLIDRVPDSTPRLLINKEKTGVGGIFGGFTFDGPSTYRDVAHLSTCDEGCMKLADLLGWKEDLEELINKGEIEFKEKLKKTKQLTATEEKPVAEAIDKTDAPDEVKVEQTEL